MSRIETLAEGVTLYLGDCRDVLPTLSKVGAVIVSDPPYGIGFSYGKSYKDDAGIFYVRLLDCLRPFARCLLQYPEETMRYFVPTFGPPDECYIWAYNSNTARQHRIFSFWDVDVNFSRVRMPAKNPSDARVAQAVSSYDWTSDFQQVKNISEEKTDHPCQTPLGLMSRVLRFIRANLVIDPFMGSGTTGVAAIALGRKFIGIEIEEKYFDLACRRISEALKQPDMFIEQPKPAKQEAFTL